MATQKEKLLESGNHVVCKWSKGKLRGVFESDLGKENELQVNGVVFLDTSLLSSKQECFSQDCPIMWYSKPTEFTVWKII